MKYTAQQIREEKICFENLTKEQFNKLKAHFQKLYPNDDYTSWTMDERDLFFRFYSLKDNSKDVLYSRTMSYVNSSWDGIKASKSITFDQFDFEETSKNEYPKVMWVWDRDRPNPKHTKRVVFMKKCNRYITWNAETLHGAEKSIDTQHWDNAEDIVEIEQLTKQQIADLLGKDINSFEII